MSGIKRKKKGPYQLVEVDWLDAVHDPEERNIASLLYPAHQVTTGYLYRNDERESFILLAGEYDQDNPKMVRDVNVIPRGMILMMSKKK